MLLDDINKVIDTLYALQDEGYYMDYIFNRGALTEDLLNDIGILSNTFKRLRISLKSLESHYMEIASIGKAYSSTWVENSGNARKKAK